MRYRYSYCTYNMGSNPTGGQYIAITCTEYGECKLLGNILGCYIDIEKEYKVFYRLTKHNPDPVDGGHNPIAEQVQALISLLISYNPELIHEY